MQLKSNKWGGQPVALVRLGALRGGRLEFVGVDLLKEGSAPELFGIAFESVAAEDCFRLLGLAREGDLLEARVSFGLCSGVKLAMETRSFGALQAVAGRWEKQAPMDGQGSPAAALMGKDQSPSETVEAPVGLAPSSAQDAVGAGREPTSGEWVVAANAASKAVMAIKAAAQGAGGDGWLRALEASSMDLSNADPLVCGLAAKMIMTQCLGVWDGEISLQKAAFVFKEGLSSDAQAFVDKALDGA